MANSTSRVSPQPVAAVPAGEPARALPLFPTGLSDKTSFHDWMVQLHSAGVPDYLLARLVVADSEERWAQRERELQKQCDRGELDPEDLVDAREKNEAQQEADLRAILGDAGFHRWDRQRVLQAMNLDLSALRLSETEMDSLYELRKQEDARQRELEQARRNGELDGEDFVQKQTEAQENFDTQLKALLGDQRFASMAPASDAAIAADLRRQFKGANLGEDQLQTLADAQRLWSQQRTELAESASAAGSPELEQKLAAADAARDQAFQQVLGADGFAQYQKQQDENYQMMKHNASAWQLNDQDIDAVYQTIHSFESNMRAYQQQAQALQQQGQQVDWAGVQQNLQTFQQQAQDALRKYLGADRFQKMRQNEFLSSWDQPQTSLPQ